ncbi:NRAMP family divalent metal transporter [Moritella viscosa]|uniref:Transporter, NRAMP family protein n=1 Tax=Moritella viscosa TaxID=80854 RepID=A0ABY1HCN3_9GAMM|nr:divalent metal cation transporter [Moritella viscosa]SGY86808.1 Transporter, NRAMP family protein [Moritella viscosa]SGY88340.1 Transporter, NRAMP family protein [Moritella viscosa]SGY90825.1 Transporter, NRAMP family protein [Moritella viscosa]SHO25048.1 Transporter, NRAMP family protein [Moritella viscosa]
MQTTLTATTSIWQQRIKSLGPGIMMATAAVGGSHLVASTKAGATYGWQLIGLILLVNLFKYPFFRAGIQYTLGTNKSLIQGYSELGKGYLWLYTGLNVISGIVNTSALLLFSASLLGYFLPWSLPLTTLSAIVLAVCLAILLAGHLKALDKLSKLIMAVLVVATVAAVVIALNQGAVAPADYVSPSPWQVSAIGFIVIMMGWMPAPIEISSITSLWLKNQQKEQLVTPDSALFDFNVGYIGTALLAVAFVMLGALVLHGNGVELKSSGIGFSHQLVSMYAQTIGEWSGNLIALVAFFCIFGSTITVIDGYSRALAESHLLITKQPLEQRKYHQVWMVTISACALAILFFFTSSLMDMLNFAMVLAFMTTPIFALINYRLVTQAELPKALKLTTGMKLLSWAGLIYLFSFLAVFIWWKWIM